MTDTTETTKRSIWSRGLLMMVMAMAFQLTATLLGLIAVLQFVLTLASDGPNRRLSAFGHSLGLYTCARLRTL